VPIAHPVALEPFCLHTPLPFLHAALLEVRLARPRFKLDQCELPLRPLCGFLSCNSSILVEESPSGHLVGAGPLTRADEAVRSLLPRRCQYLPESLDVGIHHPPLVHRPFPFFTATRSTDIVFPTLNLTKESAPLPAGTPLHSPATNVTRRYQG
jgi:hypothetical protein